MAEDTHIYAQRGSGRGLKVIDGLAVIGIFPFDTARLAITRQQCPYHERPIHPYQYG